MNLFRWPRRGAGAQLDEQSFVQRGIEFVSADRYVEASVAFRAAVESNPSSASNRVNLAYALLRMHTPDEALVHLRQAAALDAESFDAHYMLGGVLEMLPDLNGARRHFERALALRSDFEPVHADLCRVLALTGDAPSARRVIVAAIARYPGNAELHRYLGNVCMSENDARSAVQAYERALSLRPEDAKAHVELGQAWYALSRFDEAALCFERSLAIDSSRSAVHAKLGQSRRMQGRPDEAIAALERAAALDPDEAETLNQLGMALQERGRLARAATAYRQAISLRPDLPGGYANLGLALYEAGEVAQAVATYRQCLNIQSIAEVHDNLAIALQKQGAVDEAIQHFHRALELQPDNLNTRCNLAAALAEGAGSGAAVAAYRQILALKPDHLSVHSNLLFQLSVDDDCTLDEYLAEARRFDLKLDPGPLAASSGPADASGRQLRIGLVSGDLRDHPVGHFLEGALRHFDPHRFALYAYPTVAKEDELTARIRPQFAAWRLLKGLKDVDAARLIREDRIDILVDLAGHTADNRLAIFAMRPAPLQVSWLGYFASTGLSAIDYVLADEVCVPQGQEAQFVEKVWRLPATRLCYTPPAEGSVPEVAGLPALANGHLTFGCFQRLSKITPKVLTLWGKVLSALPEALLVLQTHQTGRPVHTEQVVSALEKVGIARERVTVRAPGPRRAYLDSYADVDIVLDTFPYTGGTTTCEALWMGVPTLTLTGETMIAMQGAAMLEAAGLGDWIATTPEDYVRRAVSAADDIESLARLRRGLRARVLQTPLFDVERFARSLQDAFVGMWVDSGGRVDSIAC